MCFCFIVPPAAAMEITGVRIAGVETHSVVIEWSTSLPSNGRIDYGEDMRSANRVALVIETDTSHRTLLFGLREGEEHVYRLFVSDTEGRQIRTNWLTFRTLGVPAPRVAGFTVKRQTWQGGEIEWVSNIPVKGLFQCGYDTTYGFFRKESKAGTVHQVTLDRFSPLRTIFYRITAKDARGREMPVYAGAFRTAEHNIALGAAVKGTFHRNPDRPHITDSPPLLNRVTDGSTNYFTGMATSGDPGLETQWIEVDLGAIRDVAQIQTVWRQLAYPERFSLKGSLDGERWYDFGDSHSVTGSQPSVSETGDPTYIHTAAIGQYALRIIRLEIPPGAPYFKKFENYTFVQVFELRAYPPEIEDAFTQMIKKAGVKAR